VLLGLFLPANVEYHDAISTYGRPVIGMSNWTILAISLALALDAFAVAFAGGVSLPVVGARRTARLAWHFGFFQTAMTAIGWAAGFSFRDFIEHFDHWAAFVLLAFVGGRMLLGALGEPEARDATKDPTKGGMLVMLSVATSLDALAVGLSLSMLKVPIWKPAVIVGIVALALTAAGMQIGRIIGGKTNLGKWAEVMGGVVLLAIGVKILHEHGVF
jgi:putative Mn2+ efflux pump MntP